MLEHQGHFRVLGRLVYGTEGHLDAFWGGILAAWGTLKESFTKLLEGLLRSPLSISDAGEGSPSALTQAGRSLLPTFVSGTEQESDAPAEAVSCFLSMIWLESPSFAPIGYELQLGGNPEKPNYSIASSDPSVVFQKVVISVMVSGIDALDTMEERLIYSILTARRTRDN